MIKSWQHLEDYALDIIKHDNPVKPSGSGSGKKEEDVVGDTIIVQCKYTDDKNMSLLSKDLDRLDEACSLQGKFPIFVTSNGKRTLLSISMEYDEELTQQLINLIIVNTRLNKVQDLSTCINSIGMWNRFHDYLKKTMSILGDITSGIKDRGAKIMKTLNAKHDDLTMYDLFEGEKNDA